MEKVITWMAKDGVTFEDGADCAKHEIEDVNGVKALVCSTFLSAPANHQLNWCGGNPEERNYAGACGCMGCINGEAHQAGLTYFHWDYWLKNLRPAHITDDIDSNARVFSVEWIEIGSDKMNVAKSLRKLGMTLFDVGSALQLMQEGKTAVLIKNVDHYSASRALTILQRETDGKFEIKR